MNNKRKKGKERNHSNFLSPFSLASISHIPFPCLLTSHPSPTPQPEHKVHGTLLLDVVVAQSPSIIELLPRKHEPLLVGGNSFSVEDFLLEGLDGIGELDFGGHGSSGEGFHEDLWHFVLLALEKRSF